MATCALLAKLAQKPVKNLHRDCKDCQYFHNMLIYPCWDSYFKLSKLSRLSRCVDMPLSRLSVKIVANVKSLYVFSKCWWALVKNLVEFVNTMKAFLICLYNPLKTLGRDCQDLIYMLKCPVLKIAVLIVVTWSAAFKTCWDTRLSLQQVTVWMLRPAETSGWDFWPDCWDSQCQTFKTGDTCWDFSQQCQDPTVTVFKLSWLSLNRFQYQSSVYSGETVMHFRAITICN
jgi:hypothetical protein